jgi:hypothetical protein
LPPHNSSTKNFKSGRFIIQKSYCIHNEKPHSFVAIAPQPFVTKDIIKHVHIFLVAKPKVFLGMKERLKETIVEKLQKEVEHQRAQLMLDDR